MLVLRIATHVSVMELIVVHYQRTIMTPSAKDYAASVIVKLLILEKYNFAGHFQEI